MSWRAPLFTLAGSVLAWHASADVSAGDSGEIGAAACVLGVAHPTGFPLDMLWLKLAALLPLGTLAWRQNVAVALVAAAAVTLVCALGERVLRRAGVASGSLGLVAVTSSALLTFPTFLASALGVEVYATGLVFVALAALVASHGAGPRRSLAPLLGLCAGTHVTAGLLSAPLLLATLLSLPRERRMRALAARVLCAGTGALVLVYLPLAALRDAPLDWGDPRTLGRLFEHLTGARIRDAYARDMWSRGGGPALLLLTQLFENVPVALAALVGLVWSWRRARPHALLACVVFVLDLAYAVWINPMGIAARQLGHVAFAVLALLAGVGAAALCSWARGPRLQRVASLVLVVAAAAAVWTADPWPALDDGYVVGERHGSGGVIARLPPRAVYLCSSDTACASGLFALHAELARPDVAFAPAQHLWDVTTVRSLQGLPSLAGAGLAREVPRAERRRVADARLRRLAAERQRPVVREAGGGFPGRAALDALLHARFGAAGPSTPLARAQWSTAYDELGKHALRTGELAAALDALRRAITIRPDHPVGHANLGVALRARGELAEALRVTARAVELDPRRPTPWVNLAELSLQVHGPAAAREVLAAADRVGVRDPRLSALARELRKAGASR